MPNNNPFRQAQQLLKTKPIGEMDYEEVLTVRDAVMPLTILPDFNDMTTDEGLEELAQLFDEAYNKKGSGVAG